MIIKIKGLREHNLKNIDVNIKRNIITVLTGVSGSGKSTLAIDTIAAEGQRQYVESLSTYARQYLSKKKRPDVDEISGLSPTIIIDQKPMGQNPRSTVGTVTEIYTLLRLLFSRIGTPSFSAGHFSFNRPVGACPKCRGIGLEYTIDPNDIITWDKSVSEGAVRHSLFKLGSRYYNILEATNKVDLNKPIKDYSDDELNFLLYSEKITFKNDSQGFIQSYSHQGVIPRLISRNEDLRGRSKESKKKDELFLSAVECSECKGSRLNQRALSVTIGGWSIADLVNMQITELYDQIQTIDTKKGQGLISSITDALKNIIDLRIGYLSLNRSVATLSNGESQRVKLARQMGTSLSELIYVLDEPTIGLHARDVNDLISIFRQLKRMNNTVIVVEHDLGVISNADEIIDMGPYAGTHGGEIVAQGSVDDLISNPQSITGKYLKGTVGIIKKDHYRTPLGFFTIKNANKYNLKNLTVEIPLGVFCCITGVSGSGKSSLVNEYIAKQMPNVVVVDQSPIGKSPRSIPATYVGVFNDIRKKIAEENKQKDSLFSFNSDGKCKTCNGLGYEIVDMHFLAEVEMLCEDCQGHRYNKNALQYKYKSKNIHEILEMTIMESLHFFEDNRILKKLKFLEDVGLGYMKLGQPLNTLSGGEAQRIKLASYLTLKGECYVLDEPTTGLHIDDINRLLMVLDRLVKNGNSVLVVEHNLDVIKNADWIIDLGPEGGSEGGDIIVAGSPTIVADCSMSYTGQYLKKEN